VVDCRQDLAKGRRIEVLSQLNFLSFESLLLESTIFENSL
jgi:hypothetical protein